MNHLAYISVFSDDILIETNKTYWFLLLATTDAALITSAFSS